MTHTKRLMIAASSVLIASFAAQSQATEFGSPTTAAGVFDFGTGFMPPDTPIGNFSLRIAPYSADSTRNNSGKSTLPKFSLDVLSISLAYIKRTNYKILGGDFGYSAVIPYLDMNLDLTTPPGGKVHGSQQTLGDLQVAPIIIQWDMAPNFGVNAQLQIQAPTGHFDKNAAINAGLNHWTFSPALGVTYITSNNIELSSSFQLDFNTKNKDTDYTSGIEYRHEFGIGKIMDAWTVGLGGFYYKQLTDDKGPNVSADGNRAQTIAVGPAIAYFKPGLPALWFHVYKEYHSRNRTQGTSIALRIAQSF